MDPIQTIGQKLDDTAERDAIHIAIMPAIAGEDMWGGGGEVSLVYGTNDHVRRADQEYGQKVIGIVDPFIKCQIKKGERIWVFLNPNSVTGMRHHWKHPDIDDVKYPKDPSEVWLRQFADKWNFDYDEMVSGAQDTEGYVTARGIDLHGRDELEPGDEILFWQHLSRLTGKTFSTEHVENFGWSCSC